MACRLYSANALRSISESSAKIVGILSRGKVESSFMSARLEDILFGRKAKETKSGKERILKKLREGDSD